MADAGNMNIDRWYFEVPVVTRTYATLIVICTALCVSSLLGICNEEV